MARIGVSVAREVHKPQDYASDGTDAVGFVQFWGNSPALDLVGEDPQAAAFGPAAVATQAGANPGPKEQPPSSTAIEDAHEGEEDDGDDGVVVSDAGDKDPDPVPAPLPEGEDVVNILVSGGADIRHLVKTVSRRRRRPGGRLKFFLHEAHPEALARHVLFLQIVNNTSLPVRERMETFLSLYGNALVRERDSTFVGEIAKEFVELITDNSSHPLTEMIDLSHLKFKDRDVLQDIFKGWYNDVPFDVEALREQRCRGYYRERYDHRKNLMDWDYQTHIREVAGIINWFHYKEFCFSGVAFETRLASYSTPNRTLASYTEAVDRVRGTPVQVRGFWGDIINSPYHAFSTSTDPEDKARLFKISGSQYRHTETDIAEFNLTAYLSEMETGQAFHLPAERPEEHVFPYASPLEELQRGGGKVDGEEQEKKDAAPKPAGARRRKKAEDWPRPSAAFDGVEVVLLTGSLSEVLKKPRYQGLFHRAFLGSLAVMPFFEELDLKPGNDPVAPTLNRRVRRPPRFEAPEKFGSRKADSTLACAMAPGAMVVCETLKYQAHFDGTVRLGFRHRIAQGGHLAGWRLVDERRAVPCLEADMKERRANELEKNATDFLRFVTPAA